MCKHECNLGSKIKFDPSIKDLIFYKESLTAWYLCRLIIDTSILLLSFWGFTSCISVVKTAFVPISMLLFAATGVLVLVILRLNAENIEAILLKKVEKEKKTRKLLTALDILKGVLLISAVLACILN